MSLWYWVCLCPDMGEIWCGPEDQTYLSEADRWSHNRCGWADIETFKRQVEPPGQEATWEQVTE